MYLDNVLGRQINVGIMADNAGVLAAQLHLDGNHASLHHHTLLTQWASLVYVLQHKLVDQHILCVFHV